MAISEGMETGTVPHFSEEADIPSMYKVASFSNSEIRVVLPELAVVESGVEAILLTRHVFSDLCEIS